MQLFSFENYLVCNSGNPFNYLTVRFNEALTRNAVMPMLYSYESPTFGNFPVYADTTYSTGLDYLTNPMYTIMQCNWQNMQMGGQSWFNQNGQFTGFNLGGFGSNFGTPWGVNYSSSSSSSSSTDNPEEITFQRKYNRLMNFVKKLAVDNNTYMTADDKDALTTAIRNSNQKTYKEKYEALSQAYNSVDKAAVKKFISKNPDLIIVNGGNSGQDLGKALLLSGYEFENSAVDSVIRSDLHDGISRLANNNGNPNSNVLSDLAGNVGNYDILDVVSSWNTTYKNSNNDDKNLMKYAKKCINKIHDDKDGLLKTTAMNDVVKPLVDSLIRKATNLKADLEDTADKEKFANYINELDDAATASYSKKSVSDDLVKAFDNLYLICRQAAINEVRQNLINTYKDMDSSIFNSDLFDAETTADLRDEGFTQEEINNAKIYGLVISHSDTQAPQRQQQNNDKVDISVSPEEQMKQLEENNEVKALNSTQLQDINDLTGGNYEAAWVEKNVIDGETPKIFVIDNGQIKEIDNVKLNRDRVVKQNDATEVQLGATVSAQTIRNDSNDAIAHNNKVQDEAIANERAAKRNAAQLSQEERSNVRKIRNKLHARIVSWWGTSPEEEIEIENIINNDINKNNVLCLLKDYKKMGFCKRFFHKFLDHEKWDRTKRNELANTMINYIKEYVEENKQILNDNQQAAVENIIERLDYVTDETKGKDLDKLIEKLWYYFEIPYAK